MISPRLPGAGPLLSQFSNVGSYIGDAAVGGQLIRTGFQVRVIQIVVEVTAFPTGAQWAKTIDMAGSNAFRQTASAAGFETGQITLVENGFIVDDMANLILGAGVTSPYFYFARA